MDTDEESSRLARGATHGQPVTRGQLLGPIQENETRTPDRTKPFRQKHLVPHAHFRSEADERGLKAARLEMRHELFHQGRLAAAVSSNDTGAPSLQLESLQKHIPIDSRRES